MELREGAEGDVNTELALRGEPPPRKSPEPKPFWKRLGPVLLVAGLLWKFKAPLIFVLSKLKFVAAGLKFLKFGKFLTTGLTMLLSIAAYATVFGAKFAVGFVLLILIHELGHGAAMQLHGIRAGAPVFIPFVGAAIAMKDRPRDARIEAEVGIAGPIAGGIASAACFGIGLAAQSPLFVALAHTGFFLNLFNLLPVSPLDGGRVAAALSKWLWIVGLAIAIPFAFASANPILVFVIVLGSVRVWREWKTPPEEASYYAVPKNVRVAIGSVYFALAALLALGMWASEQASTARVIVEDF